MVMTLVGDVMNSGGFNFRPGFHMVSDWEQAERNSFIYFKLRISTKVMAKNFSLGMKEVILDVFIYYTILCKSWFTMVTE